MPKSQVLEPYWGGVWLDRDGTFYGVPDMGGKEGNDAIVEVRVQGTGCKHVSTRKNTVYK